MSQILDNWLYWHTYGEREFYKDFFFKQEAKVALGEDVWYGRRWNLSNKMR